MQIQTSISIQITLQTHININCLIFSDVEWVRVKWPYVTAMPTACSLKKLMDIPVNVRLDTLAMEVMEIALTIVWITAEMRAFVSR